MKNENSDKFNQTGRQIDRKFGQAVASYLDVDIKLQTLLLQGSIQLPPGDAERMHHPLLWAVQADGQPVPRLLN